MRNIEDGDETMGKNGIRMKKIPRNNRKMTTTGQ